MTSKELKQLLLTANLCVDNKYLNKYVKLVISNLNNDKQPGYDNHHIIPRYYYNYNKLDINNNSSNLVYLSRSDHTLAHLYLFFCSYNSVYELSNAYVVRYFTNTHKSNNITYDLENFIKIHKEELDICAKRSAELQSIRRAGKPTGIKPNLNKTGLRYNGQYVFIPNSEVKQYLDQGATLGRGSHTEESKEKNRQSHLGKKLPHTKEWNEAISKSSKGKILSEECKQKISKALKGNTEKCGHNKGKITVNNGKIYKYVFEQDFIDTYQFQGWTRGTGNLQKNARRNKNKIRINNEFGAKYVTLEEWKNKYSKEGWHRGYDWKK